MKREQIREMILQVIHEIAPDEDISNLKDNVRIRDQIEIDSMDFLDIIMELRKRYGIIVPEDDYMKLSTLDGSVDYLEPFMKVNIYFGFPTESTVPDILGLSSFFRVARMRPMIKPLSLQNTLKMRINNSFLAKIFEWMAGPFIKIVYRSKKLPAIEGLKITGVTSFDDRINELWSKIADSHQIMVVRNKTYLNWRYCPPDVNYAIYIAERAGAIHGYVILRCVQQAGIKQARIYDIAGETKEVIQHLIAKAVEYSRQEKADFIYCRMLAYIDYFRALRRNGFLSTPWSRDISLGAYLDSTNFSQEFVQNHRNWFIQFGDSDEI